MNLADYFDHAATTPVHPDVLAAMMPFFHDLPGNSQSIHQWGLAAHEAVEEARDQVAWAIGAEDPSQIIFTSGATESNNWILRNMPTLAVSRLEHSSLRVAGEVLARPTLRNEGYVVEAAPLSSVMAVNNETGGVVVAENAQDLHVDATQAIGKVPWQVGQVAWASMSAHKIGGPKGVGVLYVRDGYLEPMLIGGGHERGQRAGTANVPGIVGMGIAMIRAATLQGEAFAHASTLRQIVMDELRSVSDFVVHEAPVQSPFILSVGFEKVVGEALVVELDIAGFAISSGAACSSSSTELSPVLSALGVPDSLNRGTVRISFGESNTPESAQQLGRRLAEAVEKVRGMGPNRPRPATSAGL